MTSPPRYLSPAVPGARAATVRRAARGLSLVELMVGITVGLFIVAAATVLVASQLGENRKLMLDTQLQQDLRATADIITRELRRVDASRTPQAGLSYAGAQAQENPNQPMIPSAAGTYDAVTFYYQRSGSQQGPWGFRLDATNGVIETSLGPGVGWQQLTDGNVMRVTSFTIEIQREPEQELPCPRLCQPGNDTSCWPRLQVRSFVVNINAESRADPSITRRIQSVARARNDLLEFRTPATTPPAPPRPACPD